MDPRIPKGTLFHEPRIHTVFGDADITLRVLEKSSLASVLRGVFRNDGEYERVLCHLVHSVAKDGSAITSEDFTARSVLSYVCPDVTLPTLRSDTNYFALMGRDDVKVAFSLSICALMRERVPGLSKACDVDSTPLPNEIEALLTGAFSNRGKVGSSGQTRLTIVLDRVTGVPMWFYVFSGNILDAVTLRKIESDVKTTLGIEIVSYVLDSLYARGNSSWPSRLDQAKRLSPRCS